MDILEPEEESQSHKDRIRWMQVLAHCVEWIDSSKHSKVGLWQVIYALGLPQATAPMAEVAASLGVERATISSGAVSLRKALDLPPSPAMRSEAACYAYSTRRKAQLMKPNGKRKRNTSSKPSSG